MSENSMPGSGRGLRRAPVQARSRRRLAEILTAADEIISAQGVDGLNMRALAAKAGVPVSSVYQFFESKDAVLGAIAARYVASFQQDLEVVIARAAEASVPDFVDIVIDGFLDRYRRNPGYVAIWTDRHLSRELVRADETNNEVLANALGDLLLSRGAVPPGDYILTICRSAVRIADAMMFAAFVIDEQGDPATIAELKYLERLYLEDLLRNGREVDPA